MTPERYNRVAELVLTVRGRDEAGRRSYLSEACRDDPSLIGEVQAILLHVEDSGDLLDSAPAGAERVRRMLGALTEGGALPERLGKFRILGLLGQGGMGVVYRAEQERPRRTVALKLVRSDLLGTAALRRFEHEADALARLHHPAIAQVYEVGMFDDADGAARPYFAMELVEGVPLTAYAAREGLGVRGRVGLLLKVLGAVEHAHQRGIIHRDLKPGNILVEGDGQPKVLDFGVARLAGQDPSGATLSTEAGTLLGTLAYMSPEQASGDPGDVDTRSDIYSLGVISYELLGGRLPLVLSGKALPDALRQIAEQEPARLGTLDGGLRGDLETIVAKALEKDRVRRYQSVAELAADLERHLRNEPIAARPATAGYQLRKLVRRHRALFAGVGAVFVSLVAGVVATGIALNRESAQRRLAQAAAKQARQQAAFAEAESRAMADILGRADRAMQGGNPNMTVREALDLAAADLRSGTLRYEPEVEASLRAAMAQTYRALGLSDEAEPLLREALEQRRSTTPDDDLAVASLKDNLGCVLKDRGEYAEAAALHRQAAATARRHGEEGEQVLAAALNNLATNQKVLGDYAGAEESYRESLELHKRIDGEDSPETANTLNNYAHLLHEKKDFAGAEPLYRRALEVLRRTRGDEDPKVATAMDNLGTVLREKGDLESAEPMVRGALDLCRRLYGDEHSEVAYCFNNLGQLLIDKKDLDGAIECHRRALEIRSKALPEGHTMTAASMCNLAAALVARGDRTEAEPLYRRSLEIRRRVLGDRSLDTVTIVNNLGVLLLQNGDPAGAEPLLREAAETWRVLAGGDHPRVAWALQNLGLALVRQRRAAEAAPVYVEALEMNRRLYRADHAQVAGTLQGLALCLSALDRDAEALERAKEGAEMAGRVLPESDPIRQSCDEALALIGAKRGAGALSGPE